MHVNRVFGRVRRGISMLEVGAGLTVAAIGMAGFVLMQNDATQAMRADASGAMMRTVVEAGVHYVQSRRSQLLSSTTPGGEPIVVPVARRAATEPVPENSLQSAGFLPDNWIDRNAYGHHHALLIRQAENQELRMLVVQQGGQPVPRQADLVRAAARIGPGSGFVPAEDVPGAPITHATGLGGIWSLPRSEWTVTQDGVQFQPSLARNVAYVVFPNTPAGGGGSSGSSGGSSQQGLGELCVTSSRTISQSEIPAGTTNIEYIVVGGGGGGGGFSTSNISGGGGGSGYIMVGVIPYSGGSLNISIGSGGLGGVLNNSGSNGGSSILNYGSITIVAEGGNGGISGHRPHGGNGGSGGGGGSHHAGAGGGGGGGGYGGSGGSGGSGMTSGGITSPGGGGGGSSGGSGGSGTTAGGTGGSGGGSGYGGNAGPGGIMGGNSGAVGYQLSFPRFIPCPGIGASGGGGSGGSPGSGGTGYGAGGGGASNGGQGGNGAPGLVALRFTN